MTFKVGRAAVRSFCYGILQLIARYVMDMIYNADTYKTLRERPSHTKSRYVVTRESIPSKSTVYY